MSEKTPYNPSARATARVKNPLPAPTVCRFCHGPVEIRHHEDHYHGNSYGDWPWPWLYACRDCDASVGMHPFTAIPLGILADKATREARKRAKAPFQRLYQSGRMTRDEAYRQLAQRMGIPHEECHFGWFDVALCQRAEAATRALFMAITGGKF